MSADIILLNPSYIYPPFAPEDLAALRDDPLVMDLPSTEFLYPPVGLLSIGGALKRAGYTVEGIDSNTWPMTMEELARHCESAKVVGISLLVANLRSTWQLVQLMKGRGYEIVLGGAYPSVEPEIVAKIIAKERPDAVLPTMGGQTALNCALALFNDGTFEKYGV